MDKKKLVPIEQVLDDMYNPNGGLISWAARSYYYENYADKEEKYLMDIEDRNDQIVSSCFVIVFIGLIVVSIVGGLFFG